MKMNKLSLLALLGLAGAANADFLIPVDTATHVDLTPIIAIEQGEVDDNAISRDLPFTFNFFGESSRTYNWGAGDVTYTYNKVSVNANGDINFVDEFHYGEDDLYRSWRHYRPSHLALVPRIAPYGEDLYQFNNGEWTDGQGNFTRPIGHIWEYAEPLGAYYAITWQHAVNFAGFPTTDLNERCNFQAVLFNQATNIGGFAFQAGDIAFSYNRLGLNNDRQYFRQTTSDTANGREPAGTAFIGLTRGNGDVQLTDNLGLWPNGQNRAPSFDDLPAGKTIGDIVTIPNNDAQRFPGFMSGMVIVNEYAPHPRPRGQVFAQDSNYGAEVKGLKYDDRPFLVPGAVGPSKQFFLYRPNGANGYNISIESTNPNTITGQLVADGAQPAAVMFEFRNAADEVVDTAIASIAANGNFSIKAPAGTFKMRVKHENYLGLAKDIDTSVANTGVWAIKSGDIDRDNVVTIFDYIELSNAFDTAASFESANLVPNFNRYADLDGDGNVTIFDYIILSNNFDVSGD